MSRPHASTDPVSELPGEAGGSDLSTSYESLKLHGLIRNGSALAALVLAYSRNWMDLFGAKLDLSQVKATGVSMSASVGGRQSIVLKPGDMEAFGVPLTMAFVGLLIAAILRLTYPKKWRLNPLLPLALAVPGTLMLGRVLWRSVQDGTAEFFTSAFYIAFAAFTLNTLFDGMEYFDWRALRSSQEPGSNPPLAIPAHD